MVGYWFILVIGLYWLSEQHGYWSRKELQMMGWPLLLFYRKQNDRGRKGSKRTKMKRQIWNDERLRSVPSSFQHNTHLHILQHKTWDWYGRFWKSCWTLCYLPDSLSHTHTSLMRSGWQRYICDQPFFCWRHHKQLTWNNQGIFQTRLNITLHIETILSQLIGFRGLQNNASGDSQSAYLKIYTPKSCYLQLSEKFV